MPNFKFNEADRAFYCRGKLTVVELKHAVAALVTLTGTVPELYVSGTINDTGGEIAFLNRDFLVTKLGRKLVTVDLLSEGSMDYDPATNGGLRYELRWK